jgi:GTP-binding nuclear protein Ran
MFDVSNPQSYASVPKWQHELISACGEIPILLLGNKVDRDDRKIKAQLISFLRDIRFKVSYR